MASFTTETARQAALLAAARRRAAREISRIADERTDPVRGDLFRLASRLALADDPGMPADFYEVASRDPDAPLELAS